ncbi:MAG TPA: alpha/beta hydrolase [Candidatus Saccharimonadales bacterium]|nr:alpha/beta hydrolase [Candidatus Saccharimonadales bacterium]
MPTVTSKDGSIIGFDKTGHGPAVILINGAMSYRWAVDPTLAQLAELLSKDFTVYNFDRRGRGESTDNSTLDSFTKAREIEDVQALINDAGGKAMLVGFSSGSAIALETAAITPEVSKVAVYEAPFIVDDGRAPLKDYLGDTSKLVAEGKLDELVEYFIVTVAGMPTEFISGMKQDQNFWNSMKAIAPTIVHDATFMTEFMKGNPLPDDYWSKVTVPVLVADGGASPSWMHSAAEALAAQLPNVSRHTLEGQTHAIDPQVIAPVLSEFFKKK